MLLFVWVKWLYYTLQVLGFDCQPRYKVREWAACHLLSSPCEPTWGEIIDADSSATYQRSLPLPPKGLGMTKEGFRLHTFGPAPSNIGVTLDDATLVDSPTNRQQRCAPSSHRE